MLIFVDLAKIWQFMPVTPQKPSSF